MTILEKEQDFRKKDNSFRLLSFILLCNAHPVVKKELINSSECKCITSMFLIYFMTLKPLSSLQTGVDFIKSDCIVNPCILCLVYRITTLLILSSVLIMSYTKKTKGLPSFGLFIVDNPDISFSMIADQINTQDLLFVSYHHNHLLILYRHHQHLQGSNQDPRHRLGHLHHFPLHLHNHPNDQIPLGWAWVQILWEYLKQEMQCQ